MSVTKSPPINNDLIDKLSPPRRRRKVLILVGRKNDLLLATSVARMLIEVELGYNAEDKVRFSFSEVSKFDSLTLI